MTKEEMLKKASEFSERAKDLRRQQDQLQAAMKAYDIDYMTWLMSWEKDAGKPHSSADLILWASRVL